MVGIGTNKRYADHYDRLMGDRILERVATDGELQTLTPAELELDKLPLTVDPVPKPVVAWVRFGSTPIRVEAVAIRWTPRAVGIRFDVRGKQVRCWVWASAVDSSGQTSASSR